MESPVAPPPAPSARPPSERNPRFDSALGSGGSGPGGPGDGRGGPPGGYPVSDAFAPAPRRRYAWRALLGCLIVLLASGGAAAVAVLEQVHTLVQDISVNHALKVNSKVLATSSFGQPETLLLVGNDTRSVYKYYNGYVPNLANEMLLVRIDPSKPWISMMSLPRELWVNITEPDGVAYTNRLNSAYTYGATTLLRTIKQITGLSVNHVIATTFTQFENAINKLGCVYDTVDERYYHNNADGGAQYQNIDLQPGYQCLNGSDAEQFVSYRHTDTSQVRDARDQSFLLAVKQQYGPRLAGNIGKFETVFGQTVETDARLRSTTEILNFANLLITANGLHVRQVHFQTLPCDGTNCPVGNLTATPQQIGDSVHNFMFGGSRTPKRQVAAIGHKISGKHGLAHLPLTATLAANLAGEQAAAAKLRFTAEFPKVQDLAGSAISIAPQCGQVTGPCIRDYLIHAPNGDAYQAYVESFSNGDLGQYYDVQGTTWTNPPLLSNPNQTVQIGKRAYELFYVGSHLETIAWHEYGAVYWVHNTLLDSIGNGEMLAIAEQTVPVGAIRNATHVVLKAFSVPKYKPPAVKTPLIRSIGSVGGLVALLLLPLGLLIVLRNWRRLRTLRGQLDDALSTAAFVESGLAAAAAGYAPRLRGGVSGYATRGASGARFTGASPEPSYNRYGSGQRWVPVASVLLLVVVAAALYFALGTNALGHKSPPRPQPLPTAPVAVLNAGHAGNTAHRLALRLSGKHVHVVATGNLKATPPSSYQVLYTRGNEHQARLLATLLKAQHPQVAPVNPSTAQAIGAVPKLIVVIP